MLDSGQTCVETESPWRFLYFQLLLHVSRPNELSWSLGRSHMMIRRRTVLQSTDELPNLPQKSFAGLIEPSEHAQEWKARNTCRTLNHLPPSAVTRSQGPKQEKTTPKGEIRVSCRIMTERHEERRAASLPTYRKRHSCMKNRVWRTSLSSLANGNG